MKVHIEKAVPHKDFWVCSILPLFIFGYDDGDYMFSAMWLCFGITVTIESTS